MQILRFGGLPGKRFPDTLESILARPYNLMAYRDPSFWEVLACLANAICIGHAFNDGNKRTSFAVTDALLRRYGYQLRATDETTIDIWFALAAGALGEQALASWIESCAG